MSLEYLFTEEDLMSHECLPLKTFCLTNQLFGVGCGLSTATYTKKVGSRDNKFSGVNFHETQGLLERIFAIIIQIDLQKYTRV